MRAALPKEGGAAYRKDLSTSQCPFSEPCISPWLPSPSLCTPASARGSSAGAQCPGKMLQAVLPRAAAEGYTGIGLVFPRVTCADTQRAQPHLGSCRGSRGAQHHCRHHGTHCKNFPQLHYSCLETSLGANRNWRFLLSLPLLPLPVYSCLKGKTDYGDCSHYQILTQIILLGKFWAESSHSSAGFNLKIILRERQIQSESQKYPFQQTASLTLSLLRAACRTGLEQCDGSDS